MRSDELPVRRKGARLEELRFDASLGGRLVVESGRRRRTENHSCPVDRVGVMDPVGDEVEEVSTGEVREVARKPSARLKLLAFLDLARADSVGASGTNDCTRASAHHRVDEPFLNSRASDAPHSVCSLASLSSSFRIRSVGVSPSSPDPTQKNRSAPPGPADLSKPVAGRPNAARPAALIECRRREGSKTRRGSGNVDRRVSVREGGG